MTLIIMKEKTVLDLPSTLRIALRLIYEKDKVSSVDIGAMQNSLICWKNHLDAKRGEFSAQDEENQIALEYIGKILKDNEEGKLEARKEMFRRHGIDYKKFYRLPEAFVPEDFERAKYYHSLLPKEEQ